MGHLVTALRCIPGIWFQWDADHSDTAVQSAQDTSALDHLQRGRYIVPG